MLNTLTTRSRQHRQSLVPWLILGLVLRTLIAPGYMLSTAGADGLRMVFCNGPAGLPMQIVHGQHAAGTGHDHDSARHAGPTCEFWSTSSLGFVTLDTPVSPLVMRHVMQARYLPRFTYSPATPIRGIRAPPLPS